MSQDESVVSGVDEEKQAIRRHASTSRRDLIDVGSSSSQAIVRQIGNIVYLKSHTSFLNKRLYTLYSRYPGATLLSYTCLLCLAA